MRIPSVTSSMRVAGEMTRSKRTSYPTVSPTRSPRSSAMRRAASRAAKRRGSSTMILPSMPASRRAGATRVVFPAPGGASSTTVPAVRAFSTTSGKTASMGSWGKVFVDMTAPRREAGAEERSDGPARRQATAALLGERRNGSYSKFAADKRHRQCDAASVTTFFTSIGFDKSDARSSLTRRFACIAVGLADMSATGMSFNAGFFSNRSTKSHPGSPGIITSSKIRHGLAPSWSIPSACELLAAAAVGNPWRRSRCSMRPRVASSSSTTRITLPLPREPYPRQKQARRAIIVLTPRPIEAFSCSSTPDIDPRRANPVETTSQTVLNSPAPRTGEQLAALAQW